MYKLTDCLQVVYADVNVVLLGLARQIFHFDLHEINRYSLQELVSNDITDIRRSIEMMPSLMGPMRSSDVV